MATIAENIETIQTQAAALDTLIGQVRDAKNAIEQAEAEIRQARPASDPSRAYQERLAIVALDYIGKPSIDGEPTMADLAATAWAGVE
jgi:hypothetical protein